MIEHRLSLLIAATLLSAPAAVHGEGSEVADPPSLKQGWTPLDAKTSIGYFEPHGASNFYFWVWTTHADVGDLLIRYSLDCKTHYYSKVYGYSKRYRQKHDLDRTATRIESNDSWFKAFTEPCIKAGIPAPAPPPPPEPPAPSDQGCIGQPVRSCLAALGRRFTISGGGGGPVELPKYSYDVNGKKIETFLGLIIGAQMPGWLQRQDIYLSLTDDYQVSWLNIELPSAPHYARSSEDYTRTGIAEVFDTVALGCFKTNLEAYQFFENSVKPTILETPLRRGFNDSHTWTEETAKSPNITLCNKISMRYDYETGTSTRLISTYNWDGNYRHAKLIFGPIVSARPKAEQSVAPSRKKAPRRK
jgi:hypothetical protein